jgi:hypothetical protein
LAEKVRFEKSDEVGDLIAHGLWLPGATDVFHDVSCVPPDDIGGRGPFRDASVADEPGECRKGCSGEIGHCRFGSDSVRR